MKTILRVRKKLTERRLTAVGLVISLSTWAAFILGFYPAAVVGLVLAAIWSCFWDVRWWSTDF